MEELKNHIREIMENHDMGLIMNAEMLNQIADLISRFNNN